MSDYDLVIRGGTVVTAADTMRADVGIRDGKIVAVADSLTDGAKIIDASGLLVMPGGIDSHVHLAQPSGEAVMADGFESGTRSAVAGGNTTVIPFALQPRGASLRASVMDYHKAADGQAFCDYGFHLIVTDPSPSVLGQELPTLVADGYTSFKVFMTYDDLVLNDRQILEVFACARRCQALVMIHCEGYDAIRFMTEQLEAAGKTAPSYYHAASRPESVEREATHRAISHAELTDVPIMVVHVSGREPMEQIRWAQQRGMKIYGETCPQYIALTADDLKGLNMDESGGKYVCSPPPRDHASWEAIWTGIKTGVFQTFSSDHCPFFYEGDTGKLMSKARTSFRWVPNGIPGIETRLPILYSKGVVEGRITVNDFVALTSTNHAKMYGLYPEKGSVGPGFDADIVLWDPNRTETISQSLLHHGADYTPYEGMRVTGWPAMTLLRGKVMAEDGTITGAPGDGHFLKRGLSPVARHMKLRSAIPIAAGGNRDGVAGPRCP